jgi:hypothetical protein
MSRTSQVDILQQKNFERPGEEIYIFVTQLLAGLLSFRNLNSKYFLVVKLSFPSKCMSSVKSPYGDAKN